MAVGRPERVHIVGGGAAGCVAALELLARDPENRLRITVHEMRPEAHTTLCGEGISKETLSMQSGFDPLPHVAQSFVGASWRFPGPAGPVTVMVDQPCHTLERATWIPDMAQELERRDVEFRFGEKLSPQAIGNLDGDLIIGADGPGSKTRHLVPGAKVRLRLGLQYRVADSDYETNRLEFVTDKRFGPEYAWVFPKGEILNVGTLGYEDNQDWKRIDRFMEHQGVTGRIAKRESYPIAFGGRRFQQGRVVLLGDAAGLTNPVTKGGLAAIFYAARLLAATWADGAIGDYERRVLRHPIASGSFERALGIVERSSNHDIARLLRYAPPVVHVGGNGGRSGSATADRHVRLLLRTMVRMPHRVPDLWTLYRAMALSRRYSW